MSSEVAETPPTTTQHNGDALDSRGRTAMERMALKTSRQIAKAMEAEKARDAAIKDAEDLRKQIADMSKQAGEIEAIKAELKTTKYRAVAEQVLRDEGVSHPKAIEDILKEMPMDGDVPDPKKIGEFVEAQKVERPYLFNSAPPANGEGENGRPAPGRGRGGNGTHEKGVFRATEAQLRDPAWCFAHKAELQAMAKEVGSLPMNQVDQRFVIQ